MAISAHSWRRTRLVGLTTVEVLLLFEVETAHDSGRTAQTYRGRIGAAFGRYEAMHGAPPHVLDLICDPAEMALLLTADRSRRDGRQVGRDELKRLRQALSAFIAWLPLAPGTAREDLRGALATARDATVEVRGLRKITVAGRPRAADTRHVPTAREVERVLAELRARGDPSDDLTADLVAVCYLTGIRAQAVLDLLRDDLVQGSDGRCWLVVSEKARPDRRPVLARSDRRSLLDEWLDLSPGEPLWQRDGRRLTKRIAAARLRRVCRRADVPDFTFHRLRHAFAVDAGRYMGFRVQQAGGWLTETMVEHYMGTPEGGQP